MSKNGGLRTLGKTGLDLLALCGAYGLAFIARFEGSLPAGVFELMLLTLPWVLAVKMACLLAFGVRRLTWRHVSLLEAKRIFNSLAMATMVLVLWRLGSEFLYARWPAFRHEQIPLGVLLTDFPLSLLGITGLRILFRAWTERRERGLRSSDGTEIPTLLIGTGRAGALVAKEIGAGRDIGVRAVGFVAENDQQVGSTIHGIPVLGILDDLAAIVKKSRARQALITGDNTSGSEIRRFAELCKSCGITAKIVPETLELLEGKLNLSIRDVAIEDLLRREPVRLDCEAISGVVEGRTVLVTGAGGSIGSELCREVCRFGPASLVLVEQAENSLFQIHRELLERFPTIALVPCIADICDVIRLKDIFGEHRPAVVFHAAAHKHVPMMEWNPGEAVKNNVVGTRTLADVADAYEVGEFVMISTDKAVNPTSMMGVSKRLAEIYIQALSQKSKTRFVAVRFGNVLGSAGSVVPIFKEQIARGGPVTVTHPDMKRYFMTIPEASQLVLQAASMGVGGEIFILNMGEPVRIVDLANDLIRLSGLVPGKDIAIRYTGIRPGEKLFEELTLDAERADKTRHPRIFIGRLQGQEWDNINRHLEELAEMVAWADASAIHAKVREMVPEYTGAARQKAAPRLPSDEPAGPPELRPSHGPALTPLDEPA